MKDKQDKYIVVDGTLSLNANYEIEKFKKLKDSKLKEALEKAYEAEENGSVLYKNLVFETTATNVSKLTSHYSMLKIGAVDSVVWLSKDDIQIELCETDIIELLSLISDYTGALWNVQYLSVKERIETASTAEELEKIKIEY